ncbi:MAG: hypothetical protein WBA44_10880 [Mesorhizobium sp.]
MSAAVSLLWYLVVAGPGGGMVVMPSAFDTREQCVAAVEEWKKQPVEAGWTVQCVPSAASFLDDIGPEDQPQE